MAKKLGGDPGLLAESSIFRERGPSALCSRSWALRRAVRYGLASGGGGWILRLEAPAPLQGADFVQRIPVLDEPSFNDRSHAKSSCTQPNPRDFDSALLQLGCQFSH